MKPAIPLELLAPPPRNLNGSVETYLNRIADARGKTSESDLLDSMAAAFKSLAEKVAPEFSKLTKLQELVK